MKSVLWSVVKRLSYIQDARCLKVKLATKTLWWQGTGNGGHATLCGVYLKVVLSHNKRYLMNILRCRPTDINRDL